jgi:hypothetical protein
MWRRSVWDAIHHRLSVNGVRPRNAIGLYLAGEKNLDASVAAEHGFVRNNMIAVERCDDVAERLRDDGVLTFHGSLSSALNGWSERVPCHFVVADFCCGLIEDTACDFPVFISTNSRLADTDFVVNFLRGRDPYSNCFRSLFHEDYRDKAKHRGETFVHILLLMLQEHWERVGVPMMGGELAKAVSSMNRKLFSYKSASGQYFDSVVFRNIFPQYRALGEVHNSSASPQMAAILATRTRRINAELTPLPSVNEA